MKEKEYTATNERGMGWKGVSESYGTDDDVGSQKRHLAFEQAKAAFENVTRLRNHTLVDGDP